MKQYSHLDIYIVNALSIEDANSLTQFFKPLRTIKSFESCSNNRFVCGNWDI